MRVCEANGETGLNRRGVQRVPISVTLADNTKSHDNLYTSLARGRGKANFKRHTDDGASASKLRTATKPGRNGDLCGRKICAALYSSGVSDPTISDSKSRNPCNNVAHIWRINKFMWQRIPSLPNIQWHPKTDQKAIGMPARVKHLQSLASASSPLSLFIGLGWGVGRKGLLGLFVFGQV